MHGRCWMKYWILCRISHAYKFSVGAKMQDLGIGLIEDIAAAYMDKPNRLHHLIVFQTKFETLKTLIRIAGERQWIKGTGRHAHIIELMDAIGKQSTAWKNSMAPKAVVEKMPESGR